ncbi:hypothetical protein [Flavobacterium mekongense]|uniref:hypothetical protein n=1 Tax=Flavobacterium mekongense TaxID=3379707 RepID=UPI00399A635E
MKIKDNHLPPKVFKQLQDYVAKTDFKIIDIGAGRLISVLAAPDFVIPHIQIDGFELIVAFLRECYDGFDNTLNIHADNIIATTTYNDKKQPVTVLNKVDHAGVLYVNNEELVSENGTAFYFHSTHGYLLPENVSEDEYNRLLIEDSNDETKWKQYEYVASEPNRFLTYNARLFHSKWPANIDKGIRVVLVTFYKKKDA